MQGHTQTPYPSHTWEPWIRPLAPQRSSQTHNTHTHTLPQPALQFGLCHPNTHTPSPPFRVTLGDNTGRAGGSPQTPISVCTLSPRDPSASAPS